MQTFSEHARRPLASGSPPAARLCSAVRCAQACRRRLTARAAAAPLPARRLSAGEALSRPGRAWACRRLAKKPRGAADAALSTTAVFPSRSLTLLTAGDGLRLHLLIKQFAAHVMM